MDQDEADAAAAMERNAKIMEKELGMDPRTLRLFKAVSENDVPFLRAGIKKGPDFELVNGADETLIQAARSRGKSAALKALEAMREGMQTATVDGLLHNLRLAHDSDQMQDMLQSAEETMLVPPDVLEHARQQLRARRREEVAATAKLAEMMSGKVFAKDLQLAVDTALESGRCQFEQLHEAKEKLAARIEVEAEAAGRLRLSLEHATSAELAVALCQAEEEGLIDEEGIDAGWEVQVARVDDEEMVGFLLKDLVEEVVCTVPTHIRVWQVAFNQIEEGHRQRAAEAAAKKAAEEAAEEARKEAARKRAEEALALNAHLKAQAGDFTLAMFKCAVQDDAEVLELYVQGGADLSVKNRAGMTLWELCTERGATKCLAYLDEHAGKHASAPDSQSTLRAAALLHKLYFQVELYFDGRQEETREFRFHTSGTTAAALAPEEAAKQLVCRRVVIATGLPIVATASTLLGGTPFSAFSLFEAHQHEFSLSLELILRDEWGGERRKPLLDRVRLPRGKHVGAMSTAIKPQYRRDQIAEAVEMDATAADRRKLAEGARTLLLEDLATRLEREAEEAKAAADRAEEDAATAGGPPRIVALGPLIKREVVEVKQEEKFDFGPEVDRLSVSRGHSRQSQVGSGGTAGARPLTGTGSRPGSRAMQSRGSSRRSARTESTEEEDGVMGDDGEDGFDAPELEVRVGVRACVRVVCSAAGRRFRI